MICIDTCVLIWGVQGRRAPGDRHPDDVIALTREFLRLCADQGQQLLLPSIVLAEYLRGFPVAEHARQAAIIAREHAFHRAPFDDAAAIESSRLFREMRDRQEKNGLKPQELDRQALRADLMIGGIALAHGATDFVTDNVRDFGEYLGDRVKVAPVPRPGQLRMPLPMKDRPAFLEDDEAGAEDEPGDR